MSADLVTLRSGRRLEVREYGDPNGTPILFFHGLIGSHHQASPIDEPARRLGLRIIAPNRPGVGKSDFVRRRSVFDAIPDFEELAASLGLNRFGVMGLSGGAPYALAMLHRFRSQVTTATLISGMGPMRLRGALRGMRPSDRLGLELGSRFPRLALRHFGRWAEIVRADPHRFLNRFILKLVPSDRELFRRTVLYDLFLNDLRDVFVEGCGPEGLVQELGIYRRLRIPFRFLPKRVTLWHGLADDLVPPAMAWTMGRLLPNAEVHLVPGGHFVAWEIAEQVMNRMRQVLRTSEEQGTRTIGSTS